MKKLIALLLVAVMLLSLAACGSSKTEPVAEEKPAETKAAEAAANVEPEKEILKVGTVFSGWTTNDNWIDCANRLHARQDELGIELYEKDFDPDTFIDVLENFISIGCDIVVIHGNQAPDATAAMLPRLAEAGITVAINGTHQFQEEECVAYSLGTDNYNSGYALGEYAAKWANENIDGQVYAGIVNCSSNETYKARAEGMEAALNEHLNNGKVEISIEGADGEGGMTAAEDMLSAVPELNLVLTWSGISGMGAYEALAQANWDGALFTFDGSRLEVAKIAEEDFLIAALSIEVASEVENLVVKTVEYVRNGCEYPEGTTDEDIQWFFPDSIIDVDRAKEMLG